MLNVSPLSYGPFKLRSNPKKPITPRCTDVTSVIDSAVTALVRNTMQYCPAQSLVDLCLLFVPAEITFSRLKEAMLNTHDFD